MGREAGTDGRAGSSRAAAGARTLLVGALGLALGGAASPPPRSGGSGARIGDVSFTVPDGWREEIPGPGTGGPAARGEAPGRSRVWRRDGEHAAWSLTALAGTPLVASAAIPAARAALESALAERPGVLGFEVRDFRLAEVAGAPAYRIQSRLVTRASVVEQLQYVLGAEDGYAVTFTAPPEAYRRLEPDFERIVSSGSLAGARLATVLLPVLLAAAAAVLMRWGSRREPRSPDAATPR